MELTTQTVDSKVDVEQCDQHAGSEICWHGYKGFLPGLDNGRIQVHEDALEDVSQEREEAIYLDGAQEGRIRVPKILASNLRITTGNPPSKSIIGRISSSHMDTTR